MFRKAWSVFKFIEKYSEVGRLFMACRNYKDICSNFKKAWSVCKFIENYFEALGTGLYSL